MRQLWQVFNRLLSFVRFFQRSSPQDIPQKLPQAVLDDVLAQARFLKDKHGVDVRSLASGEVPAMPKCADGSEIPPKP